MTTQQRPANFVAEIGGHQIYRDEDYNCFHLFTPGEGWWGLFLKTEDEARRACEAVAPVDSVKDCGPVASDD